MIVAVSGATSAIGQSVMRTVRESGHHPVALVRHPRTPDERRFDLAEPVAGTLLDGVDALIHLAWDWSAGQDPLWADNARAGRQLAHLCQRSGVKPVLLSTFSVFAAGPSRYGTSKLAVENEFLAVGGSVVRAGLIWGGDQAAGIVQTVIRLASIPGVCVHLQPDPILYHCEQTELARTLLTLATQPDSGTVILGACDEPLRMVEMVHHLTPDRRWGHVAVPTTWLIAAGQAADLAGGLLPFRVDSLRAADPRLQQQVHDSQLPFRGDFPGRAAFFAWLDHVSGGRAGQRD